MALKQMINRIGYGEDNPLPLLAPSAIKLVNAPTTADHAEFGQIAITTTSAYIAGLTTANSTLWFQVGGGGGSGTFASLTVTPGPVSLTGVTTINTTGTASTTIGNTGGATAVTINSGTVGSSLNSTGPIALTSTNNAGTAIVIEANGGTSEGVNLSSLQGTGVGGTASVLLESTVGGIAAIAIGSTNASAIDLDAQAGGITTHSVLKTSITSGQAAISAIGLTATNSAGGVQVTTGALAATTGLNLVQGSANASLQVGAGAPSHTAPQGSLYLNTTGSSTSTRAYISEGGGTWTALTTAA